MQPSTTNRKQPSQQQSNPFARALAEREKNQAGRTTDSLSDVLPSMMPGLGQETQGTDTTDSQLAAQQEELLKQQRRQEIAKRTRELQAIGSLTETQFDVAQKRRQKETDAKIDQLRAELMQMITYEMKKTEHELDLAVQRTIPGVGSGTYYELFFAWLKREIKRAFKRIRNAIKLFGSPANAGGTWSSQKKRKNRKIRGGIEVSGKKHEQTAAVFETFNDERSSAYGD